jgi:hypothetical protein
MKPLTLPLPDKLWMRPEFRRRSDDSPDPIHLEVGRTLSLWEQIESLFAEVFQHLCDSHTPTAKTAYGALSSAKGRADVIRVAAREFCGIHRVKDEHSKELEILINHFSKASGRRNDVAHGEALLIMFPEYRGYFLTPAEYNTNRHRYHKDNYYPER